MIYRELRSYSLDVETLATVLAALDFAENYRQPVPADDARRAREAVERAVEWNRIADRVFGIPDHAGDEYGDDLDDD